MAQDDDLARLMREIEDFDRATGAAPAQPPAPGVPERSRGAVPERSRGAVARKSAEVEEAGGAVSRMRWMLISAIVAGIVGVLVGMFAFFLPGVNPWSTGVGAALGGAIVGLLSGPPKWLS